MYITTLNIFQVDITHLYSINWQLTIKVNFIDVSMSMRKQHSTNNSELSVCNFGEMTTVF